MNSITLTGNLGHSAQSRGTDNGGMVTFTLAVNERRKNDKGEWENVRTDWFDCVLYTSKKESADKIAGILVSGTRLGVRGRMYSREYEKDGQKHIGWSVRVDEFEILAMKQDKQNDNPF